MRCWSLAAFPAIGTLLDLTCCDPAGHDGATNHVGGALFALGTLGHDPSMPRMSKCDEMVRLKTPEEYRDMAETARARALSSTHPTLKASYQQLVSDYELLALSIEQLRATRISLRNST